MDSTDIFYAGSESEHQYATSSVELDEAMTMDIGAEIVMGDVVREAVIIEEQMSNTTHHTGPVPEGRIEEKTARQKCLSKRLKTFKKQAMLLHTRCGASVRWEVISESGRITSGSHPMRTFRTVGLQAGHASALATSTRTSATAGSPRKSTPALKPLINVPKKKNIVSLPGKKSKREKENKKGIVNKCSGCNIIFNSFKDKTFRKEHRLQGEWLGCEEEGCGFWGHARCAGVYISSRKSIPSIKFHDKHP